MQYAPYRYRELFSEFRLDSSNASKSDNPSPRYRPKEKVSRNSVPTSAPSPRCPSPRCLRQEEITLTRGFDGGRRTFKTAMCSSSALCSFPCPLAATGPFALPTLRTRQHKTLLLLFSLALFYPDRTIQHGPNIQISSRVFTIWTSWAAPVISISLASSSSSKTRSFLLRFLSFPYFSHPPTPFPNPYSYTRVHKSSEF